MKEVRHEPEYEIRVNGERVSRGDRQTAGVIYANLSGLNFTHERRPLWKTGTHQEYLDMTRAEFGIDVQPGDEMSWGLIDLPPVAQCRVELVS